MVVEQIEDAMSIISRDWEGEIEGGFEKTSSWISFFEIAEKLVVRNMIIGIHCGAFIMVGIEQKRIFEV